MGASTAFGKYVLAPLGGVAAKYLGLGGASKAFGATAETAGQAALKGYQVKQYAKASQALLALYEKYGGRLAPLSAKHVVPGLQHEANVARAAVVHEATKLVRGLDTETRLVLKAALRRLADVSGEVTLSETPENLVKFTAGRSWKVFAETVIQVIN